MSIKFKVIICVVLFGLVYNPLSAANRYFKSGATVWNDASSWSATSSAGVDNAGVPGSSDVAFFDAGSGSCTLDANIDVLGLDSTGYLGIFTQGAYTIQVRGSNFLWASGTFIGGSGTITVTGSFTQSGGIFTSTTNTFSTNIHFHLTGGTFNHNSGTVLMTSSNTFTITSGNFYNLTINKGGYTWTVTNNCVVNGALTISGLSNTSGSDIEVKGDLVANATGVNGTNYIIMNGTGTQNVSGTGNIGCSFEINKPSGTLNFNSDLGFQRNYTHTAGSVNWNTYTATFLNSAAGTITNGNMYNLTINKSAYTLTLTNNCIVNNTFTISALSSAAGSNYEARGNIVFNSTGYHGSTAFIIVNGTGDQDISGTGNSGFSLEINKASGTVNFMNDLGFHRDYKYTAGNVNWSTYKATFLSSWNSIVTSGTFYDLTIAKSTYSFTVTNNCVVTNNLICTSAGSISGNDIEVRGDISFATTTYVGSNKVVANGTGVQNVSGAGGCPIHFEINKVSGSLNFTSDVKFYQSYTATAGTVNWNANKATFLGGAHGTITNGVFYNLEMNKVSPYNLTIGTSNTIVSNNLILNTTNNINGLNIYFGNTLVCTGNVAGGTSKILPAATGDQTTSGTASVGCTLEIDKTSGQFNFGANYNGVNTTSGNFNIVNGTVNQNNYTINIGAHFTVSGGVFNGSSNNITCGRFFIQTGGIFTSTSGTLQAGVNGSSYSVDITGGIFNHNNGTVKVFGSNHSGMRNLADYPFWNFEANQCASCDNSGTIYVDNDLLVTSTNKLVVPTVYLKGNYTSVVGDMDVIFTGTSNQTVSGAHLGSVTIRKPSGNLIFNSDMIAYKNWNHSHGTIVWNNHRITCSTSSSGYAYTNASFYDLTIQNTTTISSAGIKPNISNNLNYNVASGTPVFASCTVGGDVTFSTTFGSMPVLTLNGTGTQNISGAGSCNATLDINKSSGKVLLGANLVISGAGNDLLVNDGVLELNGYNVTVPDAFTVSDKMTLKGNETLTVNGAGSAGNAKFTLATGSNVEFVDSTVTAVVSTLSKSYYNLILGASKTHEFAIGGANRVTVNGQISSAGTSTTRSVLRSVADATSTWELCLNGTSALEDKVEVKYCDASSGLVVWALNSVDNTNNTNWNFISLSNFTWKGTTDSNWNTASNWEGGVVPGASDVATFVSSYSNDCNIDATVNVSGINVTNGYTGTITQGAFDITVGAGKFRFAGGIFNGSANSISVTGTTTISGGIFTSTSGTLTTAGFSMDGGVFNTNNGTFTGTTATISGGTFNGGSSVITHSGAFLQTDGIYNNSSTSLTATTMSISGGVFNGSSGSITLSTSFSQTGGIFTSTSGTLQIPSANATVFTITNGIFLHNNGTVRVQGSSTPTVTNMGGNGLYNLTFTTSSTISGSMYIDGNLDFGTANNFGASTSIFLKGDFIGTLSSVSNGTLTFNGTGNQNFTSGKSPSVVINKPSGTLIIGSNKTVGTNWNHVQGAVNWGGFGVTLAVTGSFSTITNGNFYDLTISNNNSNTISGSDCVVANKLTLNSVSDFNSSSFHIKVAGDVEFADAAYTVTSAGQKITLNGTGTQNITGAGVCGHNLEINKSSGIVTLGANLTLPNASRNLTITAGELYLNGYNVTVATLFTVNGKLSLKGTESITVNSIVAPATNANFAINTGSTIEFKDSGVTGIVSNVTKTFHHLILGANKIHEFETGAPNRVTINGILSSAGNSGSRSILRALSDASSTWELKLDGTSGLTNNINVKYSNASSGSPIYALGSVDSGDNTNWIFSTAVASVTSSKADGAYKAGVVIPIIVNYNVSVTVTGTPTLILETGATDRTLNYVSGSGSSALIFNYTVQAGDTSADLDYVATNSLSLNGGTIKNGLGDDADLTLPAPSLANSLGANKALVIDTTAPTLTSITSPTPDGSYKAGSNVTVRLNFSESITVTGTLGVNLDTGGVAVINAFSGTTVTGVYTVGSGHTSADLTVSSITVNATACDDAFNALNTALPGTNLATGSNIIIDTTAPTITSITSSTANGTYGVGANISIRINFSESITLTGTMGINLDSGGVCVINGFTGTTATGVYTVLAGHNSLDLTASSVTVNTTASDVALNDLNTALPGTNIATGSNIVIDTLAPYITSILSSTASGFYKEGDVISITISFSEPVTLASGTLSVNLSSGGSIEYGAFTGTSATGVYTVLAGENTLTLNATACNLSSGTFLDLGGSSVLLNLPGTNISPSKTIVVDTIAPTIASFALGAASAYLDVSFSEAVYNTNTGTGALLISDFNLVFDQNGGSATSASISGITKVSGDPLEGGEITYRLALSIVGIIAGVETITVNPVSSEIFDRSGNPASVTTTTGAVVLSDLSAPNITNVTSTKPNGVYKSGEVIDIEVTFSESVTVTGTPSIKIANGGSGTDALYISGSGTDTITFRYIVVSGDNNSDLDYQNTTSLFLNSGSIKDVSNNDATLVLLVPGAVSSLGFNKNIIIDTIVPTMVSGVLDTANTYVDITFSENIYATGSITPIATNDLELIFASNGGSATAASILSLSKIPSGVLTGGEDKIRVMISVAGSVSGQETILIRAATNKIFDKAGNAMASTPNTGVLDLVVSGTTPVVTKVYSLTPNGAYNENKTILIAIEFSEAVVVTGVPFLHIVTGTPNNKALYTSNLNENTLQFEYLVQADDKTSDLEYFSTGALASGAGMIKGGTGISANVLLPVPGEVNSLGFSSNIVIDTLRPTITTVTTSVSSGLYGANASIPIKILLSRNVLLENGSLIVTLNTGAKITIDSLNSNIIDVPYITKMGDLTNHLKIQSLALSEGATIQDELGGNLNLTLINKNLEFTVIRIYAFPKDYIISSSAGENGSVSPIGDFPATEGTTVQIVITPNNNYQVDTVLVNGVSVGATTLYAFKDIHADQSIHVTFSEKTGFFTISSNAGQGGSLSVESPLQIVAGGLAKISILPNIGFHILDVWVDGVSVGAVNSYEFVNVQKNSHLEAFFAINQPEYLVTSNVIGNGFISPLGHLSVIEGGDINFKITPDIGYKIKDIIVNNKSIGIVDQYSFKNVQNNNQITAVFEKILKSYIIVPISLGGGSVMPSTIIEAKENSSATVSFVPDKGHHLIDVFVDRESVGKLSEYTFNEISNNHEVIAIYHPTKDKYSIVPSLNNGGKGAKFQLSAREVVAGGSTSITIKADLGYTILDIKLNKKSINFLSKLKLKNSKVKEFGSEYTFSITDADQDYFVEVEVGRIKPTYSININVIGSGMADKDSVLEVVHGANLPITFKAIKGSHLSDVIINGTNVGALSFINLENINTNFEIKAIFTKDKDFYNIKSNVIGSGEISPFGEKIVNSGQDALFTFQAQDGHQLIGLIIDEKFLDINGVIRSFGGYLFSNVLRDHSIHAVFGQITKSYTINVKLSAGGTADFTGVLNVSFGDNHLNYLSPEEGFRVSNVIIDGKSYGAISGYSLTNVNSDHNIEVKFSKEKPEYHIIASNTEGGKVLPGGITTVLAGESLVVKIEPDEGYRILNVSLNGNDLGAVSSVLLNEIQKDQVVSATFASASMPFTIRGQVIGANQIISLGQSPASAGDSVTFNYLPNTPFEIYDVKVDGYSYGPLTTFTFTNITADHLIVFLIADPTKADKTGKKKDESDYKKIGGCNYNSNSQHGGLLEYILLWSVLLTLLFFIRRSK